MRATNKRRRLLTAVMALAVGASLSAGIALSANASAETTSAAAGEPEIDAAETTSVVPDSAKSGDLLRVRDTAAGKTSFYKVVETRDLGNIFTETLKGAAGGAATGGAIVKLTGDDGGASLLKVSASVAGGIFGAIGGLATGGYDVIFNPTKDVVLVKGADFVDTAVNAGNVFQLQGSYNPGLGIVIPFDSSFQP
ncbi:hypothetical protein ACFY3U_15940 [Micromonospora sp. NPDC000089]|uniref:hypothetical protein n=1 Tax=unclassified Micromonospora TaxID=2617518 RepID=UPI0036804218